MDDIDTILSFKGGGSLFEVQAGVSKKDLILGEVTREETGWGETKPSRNHRSLFITNDTGVIGAEFSCPPLNLDFDAMVANNGDQFQKRFGTKKR